MRDSALYGGVLKRPLGRKGGLRTKIDSQSAGVRSQHQLTP